MAPWREGVVEGSLNLSWVQSPLIKVFILFFVSRLRPYVEIICVIYAIVEEKYNFLIKKSEGGKSILYETAEQSLNLLGILSKEPKQKINPNLFPLRKPF